MKKHLGKTLITLVCAAVCVLFVTACDKKASAAGVNQFAAVNTSSRVNMKTASRADSAYLSDVMYEEAAMFSENGVEVPVNGAGVPEALEGQDDDTSFERKLIRTGNVTLEVQAVSDAEEKITEWAKSLGGYITNSSNWTGGANFTVRIPSERFDQAMAMVGDFGRIINRNVNSQDVSDNYYDLQSRLQTKYILRDKLSSYLSQAKDIKDLLEIERQLNSVIEEIESTESRFKRLSGQIDYSTIYIDMQFAHGKDEGGIILPDVKESWNEFVSNVIGFFWGLLKVLFYIVIYGIPLVAVAAFFFWLLFGKVGLLVKLFKKLKK